jgi:hypothetical protein
MRQGPIIIAAIFTFSLGFGVCLICAWRGFAFFMRTPERRQMVREMIDQIEMKLTKIPKES